MVGLFLLNDLALQPQYGRALFLNQKSKFISKLTHLYDPLQHLDSSDVVATVMGFLCLFLE